MEHGTKYIPPGSVTEYMHVPLSILAEYNGLFLIQL